MLSAEALRLAAIEVLCPTAAILGSVAYPTLAGGKVFDSKAAEVIDLDEGQPFTPVLSLYTHSADMAQRGDASAEDDNECRTVLEIVGELAVAMGDGEGGQYADALAGSDPEARLVLAAMMAQVRNLLIFSQSGILFRNFTIAVRRIEEETMALPEYGLRWQRIFMRVTVVIPEDRFSIDEGGMPEPMASLFAALPIGSYARAKLEQLASAFAADPREKLASVSVFEPGSDPETDAPTVSTGDF